MLSIAPPLAPAPPLPPGVDPPPPLMPPPSWPLPPSPPSPARLSVTTSSVSVSAAALRIAPPDSPVPPTPPSPPYAPDGARPPVSVRFLTITLGAPRRMSRRRSPRPDPTMDVAPAPAPAIVRVTVPATTSRSPVEAASSPGPARVRVWVPAPSEMVFALASARTQSPEPGGVFTAMMASRSEHFSSALSTTSASVVTGMVDAVAPPDVSISAAATAGSRRRDVTLATLPPLACRCQPQVPPIRSVPGCTMNRKLILAACATLALAAPAHAQLPGGLPDLTVTAKHDTEPVVLKGASFGTWSVPANQTVQPPLMDLVDCPPGTDTDTCDHNEYADPAGGHRQRRGPGRARQPADRLPLGSGDARSSCRSRSRSTRSSRATSTTRRRASRSTPARTSTRPTPTTARASATPTSDPADPCQAIAATAPAMKDPVKGLDANDEVAFMAADAGPQAPPAPSLPDGHRRRQGGHASPTRQTGAAELRLRDARRATVGPQPAFDGRNGYVHYQRDANADTFVLLASRATTATATRRRASYCDARRARSPAQAERRRPRDTATITTDRYRFRYDGRWLMTTCGSQARRRQPTAPTSSTAGRRARSRRTRAPRRRAAATRRRTPTGAARRRCSARRSARCARSARRGAPTRARTSSAARPSTATRCARRPGCACT